MNSEGVDSDLTGGVIVNKNDYFTYRINHYNEIIILNLDELSLNTWDQIFEYQAMTNEANYDMLKDWLKKFYEVPTLKK